MMRARDIIKELHARFFDKRAVPEELVYVIIDGKYKRLYKIEQDECGWIILIPEN